MAPIARIGGTTIKRIAVTLLIAGAFVAVSAAPARAAGPDAVAPWGDESPTVEAHGEDEGYAGSVRNPGQSDHRIRGKAIT